MLDMLVPGSFQNIGHKLSGQESSDHVQPMSFKLGENTRSSIKNKFTQFMNFRILYTAIIL